MEFDGRSRVDNQLSIAPLIDVVFLLLLFFMLTSSFTEPVAIDLVLPDSDTAEAQDEAPPVQVALGSDGELVLDGNPVTLEELEQGVRDKLKVDPERFIGLQSDSGASVQQMLDVVDRIRAGGGTNLSIAAKPRG